jgi:hypothetical protein
MLGWSGPVRDGHYSILKKYQLQYTHPRQFDKLLWGMEGKNRASPGHRKIAVWALWNLHYYIYQIEDAQTANKAFPSQIYLGLYIFPAISTKYHISSIYFYRNAPMLESGCSAAVSLLANADFDK